MPMQERARKGKPMSNPPKPSHDPRWLMFMVFVQNAEHVRKDLLDGPGDDWMTIWEAFKGGCNYYGTGE